VLALNRAIFASMDICKTWEKSGTSEQWEAMVDISSNREAVSSSGTTWGHIPECGKRKAVPALN
jgi:hypothetical protein